MIKVVYYKTDSLADEAKLITACEKLHIENYLKNSFSFCPVLIGYIQNIENKSFLYIQNVNAGFFKGLSENKDVILKETKTLKEFIRETYFLNHQETKEDITTDNSLF